MMIESLCPKCSQINKVEHKGENIIQVACEHCTTHHVYDHVYIPYSRFAPIVDAKRVKLEEMIEKKIFHHMSEKSVICLLIFNNGYEIEGRSTVRDLKDFRLVIGKDKAYEQALRKAMVALGAFLV